MKKNILLLLLVVLAFSCTSDKQAKINGTFTGVEGKNIYLEFLSTSGREVVDSTKTDKKGDFSFKIKMPFEAPLFYNLKCEGATIPLIVSPGEDIELNTIGSFDKNYSVAGSQSSNLIMEFNGMLNKCVTELDSLSDEFAATEDETRRKELITEYSTRYYKFKREHIKFIVTNATDMSAVYALYQRLPGDRVLFNGQGDLIYYRMVADSIEARYPTSPNLAALRDEIAQSEKTMELAQQIQASTQQAVNYPDLKMTDMYGDMRVLSEVAAGKVTLIDFWSITNKQATILNAELKELYKQESANGFEVYQVSLDTNKPAWILAVQEQKLPWVSVCDFRGQKSSAVTLYNVRSLPANLLLDKEGNIIARNIYGQQLKDKVRSLLK